MYPSPTAATRIIKKQINPTQHSILPACITTSIQTRFKYRGVQSCFTKANYHPQTFFSLHLHPAPNRPLALCTVPFLPKRTKQRLAHPPRPPHRLMPKPPTKHPGRHTNIPDYRPLPPGHLLSPHTTPARPDTSFFTHFFLISCLSPPDEY